MIHKDDAKKHEAAWCLHCERAFLREHIHFDSHGIGDRCAFDDCDGGGFDLHWWAKDDWPLGNNASYPAVPTHGEEYPLYGK